MDEALKKKLLEVMDGTAPPPPKPDMISLKQALDQGLIVPQRGLSPYDRAKIAYDTIAAFGWTIEWRSKNPIPDDAWPIDIIARHILAAQVERYSIDA